MIILYYGRHKLFLIWKASTFMDRCNFTSSTSSHHLCSSWRHSDSPKSEISALASTGWFLVQLSLLYPRRFLLKWLNVPLLVTSGILVELVELELSYTDDDNLVLNVLSCCTPHKLDELRMKNSHCHDHAPGLCYFSGGRKESHDQVQERSFGGHLCHLENFLDLQNSL